MAGQIHIFEGVTLKYLPDTGDLYRYMKGKRGIGSWKLLDGTDARGYRVACLNGTTHKLSRLVWFLEHGSWPTGVIDHQDGVRGFNRQTNLRDVSQQDNNKNRAIGVRNTSGVMGVSWVESRGVWMPSIKANGKTIHLGRFKSLFEAVAQRKSAEIKYGFHINHGRKL